MKRKRLLLILGCLAAVLLAGYGTLRLTAPKQHRITRESIAAVQKGMSENEVEVILGVPAGVYSSRARCGTYFVPGVSWNMRGPELIKRQGGKEWVGEDLSIYIRFDEAGLMAEILQGNFVELNGNESFLDRLRRWLGM